MAEDQASEASDPFESGSDLRRANAQQARLLDLDPCCVGPGRPWPEQRITDQGEGQRGDY